MNTGQSMLAIGAMILLSTLVLRVNNNLLSTNNVMNESKFGVLATSLATSIIEEANNKFFDEMTIGNPVTDSTVLTQTNSFGIDSLEVYPDFDDFDDYDGYIRTVTNLPSATFDIACNVDYVTINPPNIVISNSQTWHKRITVTVSSPFSQDTIRLASVFSYWFF